jgi:hypothetical protein
MLILGLSVPQDIHQSWKVALNTINKQTNKQTNKHFLKVAKIKMPSN